MYLNFEIATKRYIVNNDGLYECPVCGSTLGKIFNVHNDNLYTLQCPINREHCTRKNNVTQTEATQYSPIQDIKRCSVCDSVLVYNSEQQLICPNDISHIAPINTTISQIEKLGYLPSNQQ